MAEAAAPMEVAIEEQPTAEVQVEEEEEFFDELDKYNDDVHSLATKLDTVLVRLQEMGINQSDIKKVRPDSLKSSEYECIDSVRFYEVEDSRHGHRGWSGHDHEKGLPQHNEKKRQDPHHCVQNLGLIKGLSEAKINKLLEVGEIIASLSQYRSAKIQCLS